MSIHEFVDTVEDWTQKFWTYQVHFNPLFPVVKFRWCIPTYVHPYNMFENTQSICCVLYPSIIKVFYLIMHLPLNFIMWFYITKKKNVFTFQNHECIWNFINLAIHKFGKGRGRGGFDFLNFLNFDFQSSLSQMSQNCPTWKWRNKKKNPLKPTFFGLFWHGNNNEENSKQPNLN